MSWTASTGRPLDWISLFRVGDPNTAYDDYKYTNGATSGTFTLSAPTQAGQYEFRYLLNDGYSDAARSGPVTVSQQVRHRMSSTRFRSCMMMAVPALTLVVFSPR